ncbi:hypothetical protein H1P_1570013 [Hyella patelloides LEGE 07179]|uniref:Peptidase C-terminal archaeal/bacterial domain-containing protein n=1 Tax=Hyella patelloides LEGE 07179 TaxID=945734 RepID=A0A563VMI3_9CYAN|nr:calcium-binding protein [Hyella patelloides]VEP12628.1 hypothetical protein H1P_1570013 [Hyella patelloides LEGE 07179]
MEPNDTLITAIDTGITSNNSGIFNFNGEIGDNPNVSTTDDVDLYSLELEAGTVATFDIDASELGSDLDSILRVFDSAGKELAVNDDDDNSLDSFIFFPVPTTDTYYAGVSSFANSDYDPNAEGSGDGDFTGLYELIIDNTLSFTEPNDTLTTAIDTGITSNNSGTFNFSGAIGDNLDVPPTSDVDLYSLELHADTRATFDIDNTEGVDTILRVFNSGGEELAVNDDDNESLDSFISFTASATDTYYVGVSSFANFGYDPTAEASGDGGSTGLYDLVIQKAISGTEGDDFLRGTDADDLIEGFGGDDNIRGRAGNDDIVAGAGNDTVLGSGGDDTITGNAGSDSLLGDGGNDLLEGGGNNDILQGGNGNDTINGGNGDDLLAGNGNNDNMTGGDGNDTLLGGSGNDTMRGGVGDDLLSGRGGDDVYVLASGEGTDIIESFRLGADRIGLADGLTFGDLTFAGNDILSFGETLVTLNIATDRLSESDFTIV